MQQSPITRQISAQGEEQSNPTYTYGCRIRPVVDNYNGAEEKSLELEFFGSLDLPKLGRSEIILFPAQGYLEEDKIEDEAYGIAWIDWNGNRAVLDQLEAAIYSVHEINEDSESTFAVAPVPDKLEDAVRAEAEALLKYHLFVLKQIYPDLININEI